MRALAAAVCMLPLAAVPADALNLEPRYNPALYSARERAIDPDGSIYGVKFGATEKQLLEAFGVPNGVIAVSDSKKALLYGKSHLFILRGGKLRELKVGDHLVNWELSQQMDGNPFFDRGDWQLAPGIRNGMTFEEVQKLINRPSAVPNYRFTYDTKQASVTLHFAGHSRSPGAESYRLHSFSIVSFAP
jgi:hypothetical protein